MILGLGVDLVEVARFERAVARQGEHFLRGFLRPAEIDRSRAASDPFLFYALAFATKEALFKAMGTGRSGSVRWHDVELRFHPRRPAGAWSASVGGVAGSAAEAAGSPLVLAGETERTALALGAERIHWSGALACGRDTGRLALAYLILED